MYKVLNCAFVLDTDKQKSSKTTHIYKFDLFFKLGNKKNRKINFGFSNFKEINQLELKEKYGKLIFMMAVKLLVNLALLILTGLIVELEKNLTIFVDMCSLNLLHTFVRIEKY